MEYVTCCLCGSDDAEELYPGTRNWENSVTQADGAFRCTSSAYGIHPPIVRCRACGLVYANPRLETHTILENYENIIDITYVQEHEGRAQTFRYRLEELEDLVAPTGGRRILDVGCYTGVFLDVAEERGWQAWGVEPSRWAANEARQHGLRVRNGTVADAGFPADYFDVVTMWDVIEHLPTPLDDLRVIHRMLKPEGLLCIHTMDIESPVARVLGQRWPWLMEMHLYYFSRQTLFEMLDRAGFVPMEATAQGRIVRLGYLTSRLEALKVPGMKTMRTVVERTALNGVPVPVNLGDLFTAYARKV